MCLNLTFYLYWLYCVIYLKFTSESFRFVRHSALSTFMRGLSFEFTLIPICDQQSSKILNMYSNQPTAPFVC